MACRDYIGDRYAEATEMLETYWQGNPRESPIKVFSLWRKNPNKGNTDSVLPIHKETKQLYQQVPLTASNNSEPMEVFGKYKPVAIKARPIKAELPDEYRVIRNITGDPLADMPELPTNPPEFTPGTCYMEERRAIIDEIHKEDFLWPEERKLLHHLMKVQEMGFAWNAAEGGSFRADFFPPVKFPVLPHEPWVERNIRFLGTDSPRNL